MVLLLCRPTYLVANISGREYDGWANHFSPYSPIYSRRERKEVVISDIALCAAFAGLYALGKSFGWIWLVKVLPLSSVEHNKTYSTVLIGKKTASCCHK